MLGFFIAEALYRQFPQATEGELTRLRASLVKKDTLARIARDIQLGNYLKLGSGELKSGGWRRDSILANTIEAIIGAIYLDSNIVICRNCVLHLYSDMLSEISPDTIAKDPKTRLQEFLQARKQPLPVYNILAEEGEVHSRNFTVQCRVKGVDEVVIAHGRSRRKAEQAAAKMALELLIS